MKKHIFKSISLTLGLLLSLSNINTLGMIEDLGTIKSNGNFIKPDGTIILPHGKTKFKEIPNDVMKSVILPFLETRELGKNIKWVNKELNEIIKYYVPYINDLPNDIIRYEILPYLSAKDLVKNIKPISKKFYKIVNNYIITINPKNIMHVATTRNIMLYMLEDKNFLIKSNKIKTMIKNIKEKLKNENHVIIITNFKNKSLWRISNISSFKRKFLIEASKATQNILLDYNKKLHCIFNLAFFRIIKKIDNAKPTKELVIFTLVNLIKESYRYKYHKKIETKQIIKAATGYLWGITTNYIQKKARHIYKDQLEEKVNELIRPIEEKADKLINPLQNKLMNIKKNKVISTISTLITNAQPKIETLFLTLCNISNVLSIITGDETIEQTDHPFNETCKSLGLNIEPKIKTFLITFYNINNTLSIITGNERIEQTDPKEILLNETYKYLGLNKEKLHKKLDHEIKVIFKSIYPNRYYTPRTFKRILDKIKN